MRHRVPPAAVRGDRGARVRRGAAPGAASAGRAAYPVTGRGHGARRHRPDGTELKWKQIGINGLIADPQLPFFIQWDSPRALHPSNGADPAYSLACLEIAGDPQRVSEWLGESVEAPLEDVKVEWVAPHGTPGIIAVQVQTPHGLVRL